MAIINLFSKRRKQLREGVSDVYQYDVIPPNLRVQVVHVIKDFFNEENYYGYPSRFRTPIERNLVDLIYDSLCREYGVFKLTTNEKDDKFYGLLNFILQEKNTERVLDAIELVFKVVDNAIRRAWNDLEGIKSTPDDAILELNKRFLENNIGYCFASGEIIRIDSQILHVEVVKPVLVFLQTKGFDGANDEFLKAHEHYRHQRNKECLVECLKAFESTMKVICAKRKWAYSPSDSAAALVKVLFDNGLVPNYMQNHFSGLRSILESVATPRNKTSGHGQGAQQIVVPAHLASYALHLTGTTILFLAELDKALP